MAKNNPVPDIEPVISRMQETYPDTRDQLIPMLQFVQNELGYLPDQGMNAIASYLKVPAAHVFGVATFYAQFRFKPLGKNRITVCRGTACHVRGSGRLVEELERELEIKAGESTDDLMFSLQTVACLGSCALAPMIVVNDKVFGKVTAKKVRNILGELRGDKAPPGKKQPEPSVQEPAAEEKAAEAGAPEKSPPKEPAGAAARPPKKAARKKAAKKSAKKAVKRKAGKAAKKGAKRSAKKAARKTKKASKKAAAKRPARKAAKKSAKKSAKKPAKKKVVKKVAKKKAGRR